mgnify:CR=1 FL=1
MLFCSGQPLFAFLEKVKWQDAAAFEAEVNGCKTTASTSSAVFAPLNLTAASTQGVALPSLTLRSALLTQPARLLANVTRAATGETGFAMVELYPNEPPFGGTCTVVAPAGPLTVATEVQLRCSGWRDGSHTAADVSVLNNTAGLTFSFRYTSDARATSVRLAGSTAGSATTRLPTGNVQVQFVVSDSLGASTTVTQTVAVAVPADIEALLRQLVSGSNSELQQALVRSDNGELSNLMGLAIGILNDLALQGDASGINATTRQKMRARMADILANINLSTKAELNEWCQYLEAVSGETAELSDTALEQSSAFLARAADTLPDLAGSGLDLAGVQAYFNAVSNVVAGSRTSPSPAVQSAAKQSVQSMTTFANGLLAGLQEDESPTVVAAPAFTVASEKRSLASFEQRAIAGFAVPPVSTLFAGTGIACVLLQVIDYGSENPFAWASFADRVSSVIRSLAFYDCDTGVELAITNLTSPVTVILPRANTTSQPVTLVEPTVVSIVPQGTPDPLQVLKGMPHMLPAVAAPAAQHLITRTTVSASASAHVFLQVLQAVDLQGTAVALADLDAPLLHAYVVPGDATDWTSASSACALRLENITAAMANASAPAMLPIAPVEANWTMYYGTQAGVVASACPNDADALAGNVSIIVVNAHPTLVVQYQLEVIGFDCRFFDETQDAWLSHGCRVSAESSTAQTECLCDHLTIFGGSGLGDAVVTPNTVSFTDVSLFANLDDNPVVFIFVVVIWLGFFVAAWLARRADRVDALLVGPMALSDNHPSHEGIYEVLVRTGSRPGAGTKANVYIELIGDSGRSSGARLLRHAWRPHFRRASQDVFIVTTPKDLGTIEAVRVWHDNAADGSWFLNRMRVRNLNSQTVRVFPCGQWLSLGLGDGLITRHLTGVDPQHLDTLRVAFVDRASYALDDDHMWLSGPEERKRKKEREKKRRKKREEEEEEEKKKTTEKKTGEDEREERKRKRRRKRRRKKEREEERRRKRR